MTLRWTEQKVQAQYPQPASQPAVADDGKLISSNKNKEPGLKGRLSCQTVNQKMVQRQLSMGQIDWSWCSYESYQ